MCDTPTEVTETNQGDGLGAGEESSARTGRVMPALSGADPVRIADGFYVLRSGTGERVLDIEGNSDAEAANAQLYHANGTEAQVFGVSWDADAEAMAICHAGLCLTKEGGDGIGTVRQSTGGVAKAQRWLFEPVDGEDGWYYIRNLFGFYLDVDFAVDADCTNVKCWEFNGSPAQRWKPVAVSGSPASCIADGAYILRSAIGKWVLDIDSGGESANARLRHPDGTASQVFDAAYDEATGAMTVRHARTCPDGEDDATCAQKWVFEALPDEDGWYYIRDLHGNYLDAGDAPEAGTHDVACRVFDGSRSQRWRVGVPSLAYAAVTLPESTFAYVGSPIEPAVTVSLASRVLEEGTDYDVAYKHNVGVGTACVIVTGRGDLEGSAKTTFEIVPASLAAATVIPADSTYECRGKAIKPKVSVALDDVTLEKGADYVVSFDDNTDTGTATVTVTGKGNYAGVGSATFEIVPARTSLKKAKVTLVRPSFAYTGEAIEPPLSVTLKGRTLVRDTDYSVAFADNTNAGIATVTVTGTGDYKGSAKATFEIRAASIKKATVTPADTTCAYTGRANKPPVTVTLNGATLEKGADYSVAFADNTNAGTATVTVTGKGNYKGSAKATFEICAANLDQAIVTPAKPTYAYAGRAIKPDVTVLLNGATLTKGTDYAVSFEDNAAVGCATVTVTGKGNYVGSASATFNIVPAKVAVTKATAKGRHVTVTWEARDGVSGYQVQVAEDSAFTHIKKSITVLGALSSSVKIAGLARDTTYYVRLRAFEDLTDMRCRSAWSATKKARTK